MVALIGIVLVGAFIYLNTWLGRRRFNRMNSAGVQEYEGGYNNYLKTKVKEGAVSIVSMVCCVSGFPTLVYGLYSLVK